MPILEFYGAGGLEMTQQLKNALGRYAKYCCKLPNGWKFKATNLNPPDSDQDNGDQIILSIPVYFLEEEKGKSEVDKDDTFYSFSKILIDQKGLKQIDFKKICQMAEEKKTILQKLSENKTINEYNIKLLNIQSGNERYWRDEITKIENKTFYVFYWTILPNDKDVQSGKLDYEKLKSAKRKYEVQDKIWGYSKFMRDFLKIRNRCFEWEIDEIKNFEHNLIKQLIQNKIEKINKDDEKENIKNQIQLLNTNVNNILQQYKLNKKDKSNFNFADLAKLHLYNRNNHFETEYFDDHFDFVKQASGSAHRLLNEKDKLLLVPGEATRLGSLESKLFFYDLFKNITDSCINYSKPTHPPDFVFLDDVDLKNLDSVNDKNYLDKYKRFHDWFPDSGFYYSTDREFLEYLFKIKKDSPSSNHLNKFSFNEQVKFENFKIDNLNKEGQQNKPLFIGIDIDWNGEEIGLELLKKFRKNVHRMKRPCFIFVFSRYEYPSSVRKAIASGALFYVTKQNYMNLVPRVHLILRRMENPEEIVHNKYHTYENWHLLKKLEPAKIIQLKSQVIEGMDLKENNWNIKKEQHEYKWIKKLPKADLHCHIGSCIGPDFLPVTALTVLSELYPPDAFKKEKKVDTEKQLKCIFDFVSLFVNGLKFEGEKLVLKPQGLNEAFGIFPVDECLFEGITTVLDLKNKKVFPETALLDPNYSDMDLALFGADQEHNYFKWRQELKRMKVSYDTIMLFFILLIYCKEKHISNAGELTNKIREILVKLFGSPGIRDDNIDSLIGQHILNDTYKDLIQDVTDFITNFFRVINKKYGLPMILGFDRKGEKTEILRNLQSAKEGGSGSLFNYLRGCEYGGAPHLQTKTSIYLACYYIVHEYAIPDNIRYLTLRCAVDGYKKFGLIKSNEEAMEALLKGLDHAVKKANAPDKRIHVDVILTAKRHKSMEEFTQNADLALKFRNGLLTSEQVNKFVSEELNNGLDKIHNEWDLKKSINEKIDKYFSTLKDSGDHDSNSFFDTKPKVVSFDLAGLEKGNRAGKYYDQFLPLLKKCFPITIHAGEEDSYEAIWEAIYEVQSQRIGHALTLRNSRELLDIVKDRHIAIELCPVSNILTKNNGKWEPIQVASRNDKAVYEDEKYYPLRQYLMENIDVTINTDNPFVSGATLTDEFMVAAKMAGGLTKWEILRLIKNSFRSAALPKEQKKRLMDEIDDEIYNYLLDER